MSPINANPVRANISVVSETDLSGTTADTFGAPPASTEALQAVGAIVPPGGLHPIAGGQPTAAMRDVIGDVTKGIGDVLKGALDGTEPLVVPGGLKGACHR